MNAAPPLSIGMPVYNGARYVAAALDALLGQTYGEFELVISDNASTDATQEICREYAAKDSRVRYLRQPVNIGAGPNHNAVFHEARGELFKWAAGDDLYAEDLLARCVELLDERPDVVLSHCQTAMIDETGQITRIAGYSLTTDSPAPDVRFRSLLFDVGGDDDYGVIRTAVLRNVRMYDSYWHADRTIVAELALHGRFGHVPEPLYFRRDHPDSSVRANRSIRSWCANMDPRRAGRLRHPLPRLLAEYVWAYAAAVRRAPLDPATKARCLGHLASWLASRSVPARLRRSPEPPADVPTGEPVSVSALVAGPERRRSS